VVGAGQTADASSIRFANTTITTPTAGEVLVSGHFNETQITCNSSGSCSLQVGVWMDGLAVPNGARTISAPTSGTDFFNGTVSGIVADVPEGDHVLELSFHASGNWASAGARRGPHRR
jgi:hypothetical protein